MSYGILQMGQDTRKQAMQGMGEADQLEQQRDAENQQLQAQQQNAQQQEYGALAGTALTAAVIALPSLF